MGKRLLSMTMAVIMLCTMYVLGRTAASYTMAEGTEYKGDIVIIDAGHGGNDPGKVGVNDALEKDINLNIALLVKDFLEQNDIKVIMTREKDEGLYSESDSNKKIQDVKNRVKIMETPGVALAVSIHQNSYSGSDIKGAQVFYYTHSKLAEEAAEIMQTQLIEGVDKENHRQAKANDSYYLLKKSPVPTIIVECGFLSSPEEAALLVDEGYQEKMAWNIHLGILKYINKK